MARVTLPEHLLGHTGGERCFDVQAGNYRDLVRELERRFPGIGEALEKSAVAIDGQIYQDAWLEPIGPESEVFLMQRIEGG